MIDPLDPRRNAIRDDLADARLKGKVDRPRYAEPVRRVVSAPSTRCRIGPDLEAFDTEFLLGEPVDVFDVLDGELGDPDDAEDFLVVPGHWSWVQSAVDHYVGYVRSDDLSDPGPAPTHMVSAPRGILYPKPSIKAGLRGPLPLGAAVHVEALVEEGETYARLADTPTQQAAFVLTKHLRAVDAPPSDWVAIAELFVGTPYVWGGKTYEGIDCSGLVQLALQSAGHAAPRDSDMQAEELGAALPPSAPLTRGDLVFWRGHVGIMVNETRVLHANGHHMMTVVEPLAETVARLANMGLPVTVRRRIG